MQRRDLWCAALAVLACGAWMGSTSLRPARRHPLRYACWYWHRPFSFTAGERADLRSARIERLYVYAGTLIARGGALRLERPQRWLSVAPCELYAVIRVHPQAHDTLLAPGGASQALALLRKLSF